MALVEAVSDALDGAGWYQRGTRAHANCIENLPIALSAPGTVAGSAFGLAIIWVQNTYKIIRLAGDVYQINLTLKYRFAFSGDHPFAAGPVRSGGGRFRRRRRDDRRSGRSREHRRQLAVIWNRC